MARRRRKKTGRISAWSQSDEFRAIGRAFLTKYNVEVLPLVPKCGAKARSTGEPCRAVPLANGRCRLHGGATPSGDHGWHRLQLSDDPAKAARKIRDAERAAAKRKARLAKMTPEERAAHEHWQRTHKATTAGERARLRAERKQSAANRKMFAEAREPAPSPEVRELLRLRDVLKRDLAEWREAQISSGEFDEGVFG